MGRIAISYQNEGNPSFTFKGDLDTGIYHNADNEIGVACSGHKVCHFSPSGMTMASGSEIYDYIGSSGYSGSSGTSGYSGTSGSVGPSGFSGTAPSSPTFSNVTISSLLASLPVFSDANKVLISKSISDTRTALGLGTADSPSFAGISAAGDVSFFANQTNYKNSSDDVGTEINFKKSRGTYSSPTSVVEADNVAGLNFYGYDGTEGVERYLITGRIGVEISDINDEIMYSSFAIYGANLANTLFRLTEDSTFPSCELSCITSGAGTNTLKYNTSTKYITYDTSDARVKTNLEDLSYGLNEVLKIIPKFFDQYDGHFDPRSGELITGDTFQSTGGFIAQEVYDVAPRAVYAPENSLWNINDRIMLGILWKGVQELSQTIKQIEETVNK